jgi:hypothetical protein
MSNQFIVKMPSGNMIVANDINDYAYFGGGGNDSTIEFLIVWFKITMVMFIIATPLYLILRCL